MSGHEEDFASDSCPDGKDYDRTDVSRPKVRRGSSARSSNSRGGPCLLRKASDSGSFHNGCTPNVGSRLSRRRLVRPPSDVGKTSRRADPANPVARGPLCLRQAYSLCSFCVSVVRRECSTSRCRIGSRCEWCGGCRWSAPRISVFATAGWCIVGRGSRVRVGRGARIEFSPGSRLIIGGHRLAPAPGWVILERNSRLSIRGEVEIMRGTRVCVGRGWPLRNR